MHKYLSKGTITLSSHLTVCLFRLLCLLSLKDCSAWMTLSTMSAVHGMAPPWLLILTAPSLVWGEAGTDLKCKIFNYSHYLLTPKKFLDGKYSHALFSRFHECFVFCALGKKHNNIIFASESVLLQWFWLLPFHTQSNLRAGTTHKLSSRLQLRL